LWVDCSQWLIYSAGFFSLVKLAVLSPLPLWSILLGAGIPLYIFCVLLADTCQRRKNLRFDGAVRFSLLMIGGAIAVL
ncbi:MAG: hypothetical protein DCF15_19980, partial [Phormidesmis priestleyi]